MSITKEGGCSKIEGSSWSVAASPSCETDSFSSKQRRNAAANQAEERLGNERKALGNRSHADQNIESTV